MKSQVILNILIDFFLARSKTIQEVIDIEDFTFINIGKYTGKLNRKRLAVNSALQLYRDTKLKSLLENNESNENNEIIKYFSEVKDKGVYDNYHYVLSNKLITDHKNRKKKLFIDFILYVIISIYSYIKNDDEFQFNLFNYERNKSNNNIDWSYYKNFINLFLTENIENQYDNYIEALKTNNEPNINDSNSFYDEFINKRKECLNRINQLLLSLYKQIDNQNQQLIGNLDLSINFHRNEYIYFPINENDIKNFLFLLNNAIFPIHNIDINTKLHLRHFLKKSLFYHYVNLRKSNVHNSLDLKILHMILFGVIKFTDHSNILNILFKEIKKIIKIGIVDISLSSILSLLIGPKYIKYINYIIKIIPYQPITKIYNFFNEILKYSEEDFQNFYDKYFKNINFKNMELLIEDILGNKDVSKTFIQFLLGIYSTYISQHLDNKKKNTTFYPFFPTSDFYLTYSNLFNIQIPIRFYKSYNKVKKYFTKKKKISSNLQKLKKSAKLEFPKVKINILQKYISNYITDTNEIEKIINEIEFFLHSTNISKNCLIYQAIIDKSIIALSLLVMNIDIGVLFSLINMDFINYLLDKFLKGNFIRDILLSLNVSIDLSFILEIVQELYIKLYIEKSNEIDQKELFIIILNNENIKSDLEKFVQASNSKILKITNVFISYKSLFETNSILDTSSTKEVKELYIYKQNNQILILLEDINYHFICNKIDISEKIMQENEIINYTLFSSFFASKKNKDKKIEKINYLILKLSK